MRHIEEVARGLACGCFCVECQRQLVARKGDIRVAHFAHRANTGCEPGVALWHAAREILLDAAAAGTHTFAIPTGNDKRLGLTPSSQPRAQRPAPAITITLNGRAHQVLLRGLSNRRKPREHAATTEKRLEIDLSGISPFESRQSLRDTILYRAPRRWQSCEKQPAPRGSAPEPADRTQPTAATRQRAQLICDELTHPTAARHRALPWPFLRARGRNKLEATDAQWRRDTVQPRIVELVRPGIARDASTFEYAARAATPTGDASVLVVIVLGLDTTQDELERRRRYITPTLVVHAPADAYARDRSVQHMEWLGIETWQAALDHRYWEH
ncbi:hypothetical protein J7355_16375 [Endozoicomonas sp. G2_2]|uniref:competence protein CoiA family protein n=1 Tax=Endozoicomonas sp. G2_2 TaxID=2821092 RepID=UPI001ADB73AB|nr:hypothetical protein [Endozoicomonas sp. G2_2]MBO9471667.1 hypothetical protein [Endozoicomonas sp. G2_2]